MNLFKPKFWESKNNLFVIILFPLSLLYYLITILKKKFIKPKKFDLKIICVGNIYLGGTGKTPLAIELVKSLQKRKKKSVLIKKLYRDQLDEQKLISKKVKYSIFNKSRIQAIKEAERKNFKTVILDDGLQDQSFEKDINIICFNSNQSIGNGFLLPAGPLRENLSSMDKSSIVVINGKKNNFLEKKILSISNNIKIFYSKYLPLNIKRLKNKKIFAFAGIGNPDNFFKVLKNNNLNVKKTLSFPDHHYFSKLELQKIVNEGYRNNYEIITTEKDFYRIQDYGFSKIKYLKIELQINQSKQFINQILKEI
tara:strand:- start:1463 stop:2392 length:930 start_codon:yes stop_codon:yes gene_type:complete